MVPPLVTLEEHYLSPHIRSDIIAQGKTDPYEGIPSSTLNQLHDLGESRIKDLDAGKISLQVISHSALDGSPSACRAANDDLAAACRAHPTRFAGWAKLPMEEPVAMAEELKRCVGQLGFVGALINTHLNGIFYDSESFWPVFAAATELDVPIYLHPTFAADEDMDHYRGNFSDKAALAMSAWAWGSHSETGLHFLRLWASGLFDRFPGLKLVLGHMGEMLPYMLERIVEGSARWGGDDRKRGLREVWRENVWVTTSGMFSVAPLGCLLKVCDVGRVLYSVDYPSSKNEMGLEFVRRIEREGVLRGEELEKVCWRNAEELLKVRLQK